MEDFKEKSEGACCCGHTTSAKTQGKASGCLCGAEAINILESLTKKNEGNQDTPELINTAEDIFDMENLHKLVDSTRGLWELHKEVIDATIQGGWDNDRHRWARSLQSFWKYPLAFSTYAIPSLIMIEPGLYEEAADYMKKSILLMKDTPVWDDYTRNAFAGDPVSYKNIMYKGHLNLMYGLYQMVTGNREFEEEYQNLTNIIVEEYDKNAVCDTPYWGVECEPDQYFPQCNSMGMMSMKVHDIVFGTNYEEKYSKKILQFIKEKLTDKDTGLIFAKYHASHDQAEAYITGFCNSWALVMLHRYDKKFYESAFEIFKKNFVKETHNGKAAYLKEYSYFDEPSTGLEESMGVFYSTALAKEYRDPELWNKISRYFIITYGMKMEDGTMRFKDAKMEDETFVQNYVFWGEVHQGWENILNYDWKAVR